MGKLEINMKANISDKQIEINGTCHSTAHDFCMFAGFVLGGMIAGKGASVLETAISDILDGVVSAIYGEQLSGESTHVKIPKSFIHEINKEGDNENDND